MKKKLSIISSNFERLHEIKKEADAENFSPIHYTIWADVEQALLSPSHNIWTLCCLGPLDGMHHFLIDDTDMAVCS